MTKQKQEQQDRNPQTAGEDYEEGLEQEAGQEAVEEGLEDEEDQDNAEQLNQLFPKQEVDWFDKSAEERAAFIAKRVVEIPDEYPISESEEIIAGLGERELRAMGSLIEHLAGQPLLQFINGQSALLTFKQSLVSFPELIAAVKKQRLEREAASAVKH